MVENVIYQIKFKLREENKSYGIKPINVNENQLKSP